MAQKPTWRTDANSNPIGCYFFEQDQEQRTDDEEDYIQFMTAAEADDDYDGHSPPEVIDRLEELFFPVFGEDRFEADAAESLHIVYECDPKDHIAVMNKIRDTLNLAGWREVKLT